MCAPRSRRSAAQPKPKPSAGTPAVINASRWERATPRVATPPPPVEKGARAARPSPTPAASARAAHGRAAEATACNGAATRSARRSAQLSTPRLSTQVCAPAIAEAPAAAPACVRQSHARLRRAAAASRVRGPAATGPASVTDRCRALRLFQQQRCSRGAPWPASPACPPCSVLLHRCFSRAQRRQPST